MGTTEKNAREKMREWSLYLMNVQTNTLQRVMGGLEKDYAMLLVRRWNASKTDCVLFAWPEWVPEPIGMEIAGHPACILNAKAKKLKERETQVAPGVGEWGLYTADLQTGRIQVAMGNVTKKYAAEV